MSAADLAPGFCEELIVYSSQEFAFVSMDDAYSTGSSMMPQKKNPDVAELIRGKTGRVYGDLTALLTVMKGIPLAYNKDMQEDKEAYFDSTDTLLHCLEIFTAMLDYLGWTEAADLVRKGVPFRDAHRIVGELVSRCLAEGLALNDLPLAVYQEYAPVFAEDVYPALAPETCVALRDIPGGPAPRQVRQAIAQGRKALVDLGLQAP